VRIPTLATVNTLARLRLTASRLGRGFRLDGAAPRLLHLLELTGLDEALGAGVPVSTDQTGSAAADMDPPDTATAGSTGTAGANTPPGSPAVFIDARSGLQERWQVEQREQPVGVQEVVDSDDPAG
jgi:hypothetical protein